jgi:hypothetical protein
MDTEFWQPIIPTMAEENREEMKCAATSSLVRPAVIWRPRSGEDPIFVRLLNDSEFGMTFVCSVPLEMGESIELARDPDGAERKTLHVARCEYLAEDIYRVSTHV